MAKRTVPPRRTGITGTRPNTKIARISRILARANKRETLVYGILRKIAKREKVSAELVRKVLNLLKSKGQIPQGKLESARAKRVKMLLPGIASGKSAIARGEIKEAAGKINEKPDLVSQIRLQSIGRLRAQGIILPPIKVAPSMRLDSQRATTRRAIWAAFERGRLERRGALTQIARKIKVSPGVVIVEKSLMKKEGIFNQPVPVIRPAVQRARNLLARMEAYKKGDWKK